MFIIMEELSYKHISAEDVWCNDAERNYKARTFQNEYGRSRSKNDQGDYEAEGNPI